MSSLAAARAKTMRPDALDTLRDIRAQLGRSVEMGERLDLIAAETDPTALLARLVDEQADLLTSLDASLSRLNAQGQDEPAHRAAWSPPEPKQAESLRVLVVARNPTIQRILARLLGKAGHAARACDALPQPGEAAADVILIDLDTTATLEDVRAATPGLAGARLIGISAERSGDFALIAAEAGLDALLPAPIEPAEALAAVAHAARVEAAAEPSAEPEAGPTFDVTALRDLETLGGEEFARDIARHFLADTKGLLATIRAAAEAGDEATFRDQAHALRSCAANVGARAIYEQCLAWRALDAETLARSGRDCAEALEREYRAVSERISAYARGEAPLGD